jgi:hypothetical protein
MPNMARTGRNRSLRLLLLVGFALALGACSKCDFPVWRHDTAGAPQSCHDDPPLR